MEHLWALLKAGILENPAYDAKILPRRFNCFWNRLTLNFTTNSKESCQKRMEVPKKTTCCLENIIQSVLQKQNKPFLNVPFKKLYIFGILYFIFD